MPPTLVDSHCHLDFPDFAEEIDDVVARACAAGVTRMVSIATSMAGEPRVRAIAEAHAPVFYAAGLHPLHVHEESPPTVETLVEIARHPKMVGIGETGLDYHYSVETRAVQQESLRLHCEAARRTGLPLIIHTRGAKEDTLALLREHGEGEVRGVLHCFTEDLDMAEQAMELGFYISISGIVTFRNAEALRDTVRQVPLERLLIETDSPWLAPVPYRGKPNEPRYVARVAECVAELKGIPVAELAALTRDNFYTLFNKAAR